MKEWMAQADPTKEASRFKEMNGRSPLLFKSNNALLYRMDENLLSP